MASKITHKAGRKKILTEDIIKEFERLLTSGVIIRTACEYLNIDYERFYDWYNKGKKYSEYDIVHPDYEIYIDFYNRVASASAKSEVMATTNFARHASMDWRASEAFLARKFPSRWGKNKVQIDLTVNHILKSIPDPIMREQIMNNLDQLLAEQESMGDSDIDWDEEGDL